MFPPHNANGGGEKEAHWLEPPPKTRLLIDMYTADFCVGMGRFGSTIVPLGVRKGLGSENPKP